MKIVIVPGNGDSDVKEDNWYDWVRKELEKRGFSVHAQNMPDPTLARKEYWLPFIENTLHVGADTIYIGHSSGAVAGMYYAQSHKLTGLILVGCNYTDLGFPEEQASGYYTGAWQWEKIKENCGWIAQFAGTDDPYIPVAEPRFIHEKLGSEYHELPGRGHFQDKEFPELIALIERRTK